MRTPAKVFEEHRPVLLGMAYRLLGSMWDAEDVVQDAFLRWNQTPHAEVRDPRAFLLTVTSRLALDQLRSRKSRPEQYTGPWLPEPVRTATLGPMDSVELRDTVSYAVLHLLEELAPAERAVLVLRGAFELPYEELAEIVGTSPANCRQLYHRARVRLAEARDDPPPSLAQRQELLSRFLDAARSGDLTALTQLLSDDVVAWTDGGGKVRAALRPIQGREKVLAFIEALLSRNPMGEAHPVETNGEPALWLRMGGQAQWFGIDVRHGRIQSLFSVLNPDKLAHLRRAPPPP